MWVPKNVAYGLQFFSPDHYRDQCFSQDHYRVEIRTDLTLGHNKFDISDNKFGSRPHLIL